MIRATKDPAFDIDAVPLDDDPTLALLRKGDSIGVFQLEGGPMRALMRSLAPTSFDDVAALVALYRPGPMAANMHNDYADRKNGRKPIKYLHPDMEELLGDTYGLMIYQESVMRVAQKFAGYSLADADNLRKACGKKIRELIAAEREKFVDGCERTGYGARPRHAAVRHHRALRRLRLQQEPRLRLRPRRLPDRLPEGPLPGRVPRLPAHQREGQPGEGRRLPRRVPVDGRQGPQPRHQPLAVRLRRPRRQRGAGRPGGPRRLPGRDPLRPLGGPQRGGGAGEARSWRSATPTAPSPTSTTSSSASTPPCSTSGPSSR